MRGSHALEVGGSVSGDQAGRGVEAAQQRRQEAAARALLRLHQLRVQCGRPRGQLRS